MLFQLLCDLQSFLMMVTEACRHLNISTHLFRHLQLGASADI